MMQEKQTWQYYLKALQDGSISKDQFKNRRLRARQGNKTKLCLTMAKAFELYQLETIYKKANN